MDKDIKVKHLGGDTARMPTTAPGGHKVHKPAMAGKNETSKMSWKGGEHAK